MKIYGFLKRNNYKRLSYLRIYVLIPLIGIFICCKKGPVLVSSTYNIKVGVMYPGETRELQAVIKNIGDTDLIIDDISSSCNCIIWPLSSKRIMPNKQDTLSISINIDESFVHAEEINIPIIIKSNSKNILDEIYVTGSLYSPEK